MPIPDAVAGYQVEHEPVSEEHYPLQNEYLRACADLSETQAKHVRHEASDEDVRKAEENADRALESIDKYWKSLDKKAEKEK